MCSDQQPRIHYETDDPGYERREFTAEATKLLQLPDFSSKALVDDFMMNIELLRTEARLQEKPEAFYDIIDRVVNDRWREIGDQYPQVSFGQPNNQFFADLLAAGWVQTPLRNQESPDTRDFRRVAAIEEAVLAGSIAGINQIFGEFLDSDRVQAAVSAPFKVVTFAEAPPSRAEYSTAIGGFQSPQHDDTVFMQENMGDGTESVLANEVLHIMLARVFPDAGIDASFLQSAELIFPEGAGEVRPAHIRDFLSDAASSFTSPAHPAYQFRVWRQYPEVDTLTTHSYYYIWKFIGQEMQQRYPDMSRPDFANYDLTEEDKGFLQQRFQQRGTEIMHILLENS